MAKDQNIGKIKTPREISVKYYDENTNKNIDFGKIVWNGKVWNITGKGSTQINNLIGAGLFFKDKIVTINDKELGEALLRLNASRYIIRMVQ